MNPTIHNLESCFSEFYLRVARSLNRSSVAIGGANSRLTELAAPFVQLSDDLGSLPVTRYVTMS